MMSLNKSSSLGWAIGLTLLGLSGCNTFLDEDSPVQVLAPTHGTRLSPGQELEVQAVIDTLHFHFEIDSVEVELRNISTKERHHWPIDHFQKLGRFEVTKTIRLPETLDVEDEYRLIVRGVSDDRAIGLGYSVIVEVTD